MGVLFDSVAEALEQATTLDRLEARGTLRLALKAAGLDAEQVTSHQLAVVFSKLMPGELESRGIADSGQVCAALAERAGSFAGASASQADSPESVFQRLGGS